MITWILILWIAKQRPINSSYYIYNLPHNRQITHTQYKEVSRYIPALQHSPEDTGIPGYSIGIAVESEVVALTGPYGGGARADQHAGHVQEPRAREQESHDEEPAIGLLVSYGLFRSTFAVVASCSTSMLMYHW